MKISDLSKFDLKNIDFSRVIAYVEAHKDSLLRMAIVIFTAFACFRLIDDYLLKAKSFSLQIESVEEKTQQVSAYQRSVAELKSFFEKMPVMMKDDDIVNYVTDLAAKNKLEVSSFSPGVIASDKFYKTNKINFKLKARDYRDFVVFVHNLESSGYALRVEEVNSSLEQSASSMETGTIIVIQIGIASITINEPKNI